MKKSRLLFLGPPGAGKGTQAERICGSAGLLHLSTGDLLRAEVAAETDLGKSAAAVMQKGELVSDELVLAIVESSLVKTSKGWILDGFPRTVSQAISLEKLLEKLNQQIEAVISLELNDDLLLERLLLRGRSDDNEDVIRHRIEVYKNKTAPLIDHYNKQDLLKSVQADGTIDAITDRIESILS